MALTVFTKQNNNNALNLNNSWVEGLAPNANTAQMLVDGTILSGATPAAGASFTLGQIKQITTGGPLTIVATTATAITLDTTDTATLGVGIDMSAATKDMTIAEPLVLGTSQTWTVAASRTLTISGAISGTAKNLTLNGTGIKTLSGVSTGWTGSTVTVSVGQTNANTINALGAATNTVVVTSGANLTTSVAIAQTALTLSGAGFTGGTGYGAFTTTNALTSSQVITFDATNTVLSINTVSLAAQIVASVGVTSLTLNMVSANLVTFGTTSTYTVSGGVRIKSLATNGTTPGSGRYSFGTGNPTDGNTSGGKGLGANTNGVIVEQTGAIDSPGTTGGTTTLSRSYEFLASTSPTVRQASTGASASVTTIIDFQGPVTFTGTAGQASSFAGGNITVYQFSNTVSGAANLWCGTKGGFLAGTVGIADTTDTSLWTGTIYTDDINYYGTPLSPLPSLSLSRTTSPQYINAIGGTYSASHSSYAKNLATNTVFNSTSFGHTGSLTLGGGAWSSSPGTWQIDAGTLTLNFSFTGTLAALTKTGVSTLILTGNNTAFSAVVLSAGTLTLNSVGSAGPSAATFTISATSLLDSTTGATLTQNGANGLNANFTWGGSADLTFGTGALSWSTARTVTFVTAKTGTLKFLGNIGSLTSTSTLAVGGAPVGGSRSRLWLAGTNGMLAPTSTVTAGYFRVSNALGLGNASTTMWTVSSGAALEVDGSISPTSTRNVTITGPGPNTDGALRSVSGTNVWNGAIIPPVQSLASPTRIQVDEGTFTLTTAGTYTTIAPTVSGTPLQFTALGATAILNQPRQLTANVSDVTINNGGVGKVVFSVANLHTGTMTCSAGTTKVTHINATSTGAVTVPASATLESTVQSQFQSTLSLGTLSSASRAILKFAA